MVFNLLLFALLIILTAFFVATEFAIVKMRPSRVDQLVLEGHKSARAVKKVTSNLDGYLSACQLGITITALGLGWLGEPTVEKLLHPLLGSMDLSESVSTSISFAAAFAITTFLHVVIGELFPKSVAIQKTEAVTILLARPIILFYKIMYPFIWLLNGSANMLVRLFGMKPVGEKEEAHSEEELQIILKDSYQSGKINQAEYGYVNRIFAFDDLVAREIMVPRTDMVCLDVTASQEEILDKIREERFTRFPVTSGSKDSVIGIINAKQYLLKYTEQHDFDIHEIIQPILSFPEAMPIKVLLNKMQLKRVHIAILVDEYGGTSGMITIEDILEEIVGEIRDEFDEDEANEVEQIDETTFAVDGKVPLVQISELLQVDITSDDVDTIGGWLYSQHPELKKGAEWSASGLKFRILERDRHRIRKLQITKLPAESLPDDQEQTKLAESYASSREAAAVRSEA